MKVEIWSDIACPWCQIGRRRFERAVAEFPHRDELEVVWRSFELDPQAPPIQDRPQVELLARKYAMSLDDARAMNATMTAAAKSDGLTFQLDQVRVTKTFDAHRMIHLAAAEGLQEVIIERLFRAYLSEGANLSDHDVLITLAVESGLDSDVVRDTLAGTRFAAEVRADEDRARALGITGVPFFSFGQRYAVSGAQTPDALLEALGRATREHARDDRHSLRGAGRVRRESPAQPNAATDGHRR